ncbi:MAG: hypothetical protein ACI379_06140 [Nocardioides sp.]|uniref:hypothetical protein n=1 Tax=Nocardioides sp. TaxID=35761 RepID=UPI003F0D9347
MSADSMWLAVKVALVVVPALLLLGIWRTEASARLKAATFGLVLLLTVGFLWFAIAPPSVDGGPCDSSAIDAATMPDERLDDGSVLDLSDCRRAGRVVLVRAFAVYGVGALVLFFGFRRLARRTAPRDVTRHG